MGQAIVAAFQDKFDLVSVTRTSPLLESIDEVDVVIDFTCANSSFQNGILAIQHGKPIIIGTTGLTFTMLKILQEQANEKQVGCLYAPNFAYGAIWMNSAIQVLAKQYDSVDIKEVHHVSKLDVPSGTALRFKECMLHANPKLVVHISSERHYTKNVLHQLTFHKEGEIISLQHIVNHKIAYLHALEVAIHNILMERGWVEYSYEFFQKKAVAEEE